MVEGISGYRFVFLIGAGRSGSTLLYKILAAHREVAYLSQYQGRFPRLPIFALLHRSLNVFPELKRHFWFLEGGGAYFNTRRPWLHSLVPTPVEAEPVYTSCEMPLRPPDGYTPSKYTTSCLSNRFEKLCKYSGSQVLLTKRIGNNRRIPQLNQIFPAAKFIHLVRDGRAVAFSLPRVRWWEDHQVHWAGGKTPRQMEEEGADPLDLAARNWVEGVHNTERGIRLLAPDALLHLRYEELLENPRATVARILSFMMVDAASDPHFWRLLDYLSLSPRKEAWTEAWSPEQLERVQRIQGETLKRWGYLS